MHKPLLSFEILLVVFLFMTAFLVSACGGAAPDLVKSQPESETSEMAGPPVPTALPTPDLNMKVIALTFDDGPVYEKTARVLSILKDKEVKATFFLLGKNAEKYPDLVRAIDSAGHEIANHTYDHTVLTGKSIRSEDIAYQIDTTNEILYRLTGKTPVSFRPPQGSYNQAVRAAAKSRGLSLYNWSYQSCPEDWKNRDPEEITRIVVENASKGHIVLLHDLHEHTVEALPDILDGLSARGFRFVSISELISFGPDEAPIPGKVYFYYNTPTKDELPD